MLQAGHDTWNGRGREMDVGGQEGLFRSRSFSAWAAWAAGLEPGWLSGQGNRVLRGLKQGEGRGLAAVIGGERTPEL